MAALDYAVFDADNHYYEAVDAFTRHLDPGFRKRGVQWAQIDGRQRLLVGGSICRFIPNPTFDPISKPGALDAYFRGKSPSSDIRAAFGELDRMADRPEYRDRDARLKVMDAQGLDGCFLFPTLGVGIEEALLPDIDAVQASFTAFNRWLEDDWGYAYEERIFAAPLVSLTDAAAAEAELARVLAAGARIVCMRAAPIRTRSGGRSPGAPEYERFWSMVDEAGVTVGIHSGDSGYGRYADDWGAGGAMEAFRFDPFRSLVTADRPMLETMGALIIHGVFARHPDLRVATIENGSGWVPELFRRLRKFYKQVPDAFPGDPIETFRRHVWVAPFYEDDIRGLADAIGVDHVLFGSDWPHAEGLAVPTDFFEDLHGFDADEIRTIMRDNGRALATLRVPAHA
ncbi:MAG TPA: amidohydrolase family protein [Acidimicrobiales bacterium]|nr:amidohydrolase family protein [Acidimicrobiales bacterium]